MKFVHLSPKTDFSSELQSQLTIINRNILYITHEVDKIYHLIKRIQTDESLQKQIDGYYDNTHDIPEKKN